MTSQERALAHFLRRVDWQSAWTAEELAERLVRVCPTIMDASAQPTKNLLNILRELV